MNVAELIRTLAKRRYRLRLGGSAAAIIVTPKPTPEIRAIIVARKPEIVAYLRARDLRKRRCSRVPSPCAFFCGPPAATCWRCGGAWLEHPPQAAQPAPELAIAAPSQGEA